VKNLYTTKREFRSILLFSNWIMCVSLFIFPFQKIKADGSQSTSCCCWSIWPIGGEDNPNGALFWIRNKPTQSSPRWTCMATGALAKCQVRWIGGAKQWTGAVYHVVFFRSRCGHMIGLSSSYVSSARRNFVKPSINVCTDLQQSRVRSCSCLPVQVMATLLAHKQGRRGWGEANKGSS
jgi:hypothetical protein